ncbi:MAG: U32 family peptidase [Ruminococcaceae bacterium]|nr:U32 family peptidase [Oscillospiraceae bacterium]
MQSKTEILAPAGSMESLIAAVRVGADAVYLGVNDFNARRNAENFGVKELRDAILYCHVRGVKVYITLNTLIFDSEIPSVLELIKCGCAFGADAFIIQDLGIAKLVREVAPNMPMHASTQMAVSTVAGFKELEKLGFSRAILPRELSFEEIKEIKENTEIELEMFVHGALCMSVSGQCYLSGMLGGRSGNRGLCAQPCRLPFFVSGGTGHDLSLKDLSLIDHIKKLSDLGITSFKIEGRMKRPEYVAAAVTACKNALIGKEDESLKKELKAVFSRSGFTDGYLTGKLGKSMFGIRSKDDVIVGTPVLRNLSRLYNKEKQEIPITISLTGNIGKPLLASASNGKIRVFVTSDYKVQKAKTHTTEVADIRKQLHKTGGTPFKVMMTDIDIDKGINIPMSEINNIRRGVIEALEMKLTEGFAKEFSGIKEHYPENIIPHAAAWKLKPEPVNNQNFMLRFLTVNQIPDDFDEIVEKSIRHKIKSIIVPLKTPEDKFSYLRKLEIPFGIEIPRGLYGFQGKNDKLLKDAIKNGAAFAFVGTLDGIALARKHDLKIVGGPTLNITNSFSLYECTSLSLSSVIVSTELEAKQINALRANIPRGVLVYGRTPLMLTRNCPVKNGKSCKTCKQDAYLTDRKKIRFPVVCNNGVAEVLNSRPIYLADHLQKFDNTDFQLLYFTKESKEKVKQILNAYENELPPTGEFTRGLYFRGTK